MGITDKAKQMRDKVAQSSDEYIDKARDKAKQATGGRFDDTIDKSAEKAKGAGKRPDEQGRVGPDGK
jgi:MT0933-like antitoxin protein